ncbi:hypothetical protein CD110_08760 [Staphylococcus casei]|uniref:hypothetical protein n=1 Tax=Staphylococcus TaxID=1279 RepID=UPI000CD13576|nr:hypothetical protein [Staphylococcus casei]PNZ58812.1 hypothetical protein CD110_08760 [Staphylococcus casei]WJE86173.1 hypothetical protein QMO72_12385 [Staphylococcus casei]
MLKKKMMLTLIFFVFFSFGIALQVKSNIGQSAMNAFGLSLSSMLHIKIGTTINLLNTLFFLTYVCCLKFKISLKEILQFGYIIINGVMINFFVYLILPDVFFLNYTNKLFIFIIGVVISGVSLGILLFIGLIKFPLEAVCIEISNQFQMAFGKVRYLFDAIFVLGVLTIYILDHSIFTIREGTVISVLLLSYIISFTMKLLENVTEIQ